MLAAEADSPTGARTLGEGGLRFFWERYPLNEDNLDEANCFNWRMSSDIVSVNETMNSWQGARLDHQVADNIDTVTWICSQPRPNGCSSLGVIDFVLHPNYHGRSAGALTMDQPKQEKQRATKGSTKLRGHLRDDPKTRTSKTLSYVLRHGAKSEGIPIRPDGYVRVKDLVRAHTPSAEHWHSNN
jgi:hypothetical protein